MTQTERRKNIAAFIKKWDREGYKEDGNTATFWIELLGDVLGVARPTDIIKFEETFKHEQKGNPLYCDAWIPSLHILIEQKAPGVALDAAYERHGRTFKSAYEQAAEYDRTLSRSESSRYIIASNFREIWIYDMERREADREPVKILLKDLAKDYKKLAVLIDKNASLSDIVEVEVSVEAGQKIDQLYQPLLAEYKTKIGNITPEDLHNLNVFCVRIVFCLYAEDAGLFAPDAFARYLESYRPENARDALINLFKILDQKKQDRDPFLSAELAAFPYVNGGLFRDAEKTPVPPISEEVRNLLVHDMSRGFDWSRISPTIFGAIFESTLNPETRRKGGMHYTSVENIHKVIDPLFLEDLRRKVDDLIQNTPEDQKYNRTRTEITLKAPYEKRLRALQTEMASLTFLDPACGSGNFLTETFLSLRRLENKIISQLFGGDTGTSALLDADYIRVSIAQFHGIEINDFAVTVAKTALWIAESQMLKETERLVRTDLDFLPLKTNANIIEGNALTTDWDTVIPKMKLNYIMGNPPFVGASMQTKEQKEEIFSIYLDEKGKRYKTAGLNDYVSCWFYKAAKMMKGTNIRAALVSTNSITQGEQVASVWKPLYEQFGIHIDFAYRTFRWDSEANLKAHVHCVIIGFSYAPNSNTKKIYEIAFSSEENKTTDKNIGKNENRNEKPEKKATFQITEAQSINAYLFPGDPVFVESRTKPLCDTPLMRRGNQPTDGGYLIFTKGEKEEFLQREPSAKPFFKKFSMGKDFLTGEYRYCLWLVNASPRDINAMPLVKERVRLVQEMRLQSTFEPTRKLADTPTVFREQMNPAHYLAIPIVTSERRRYIPIGYLDDSVIPGNKLLILENATLYHFGVLTSNVHMAWMRTVAGRLKSDYSYSKDIVYNNFPWPNPTDEQKQKIERTAQNILDARARYPESSLADLYDPLTQPSDLQKAHRENDRAVYEAYGKPWDITSEPACIAYLMQAYRALTEK